MSATLYPPDPTLDDAEYDKRLDEYRRRVEDMRDAEMEDADAED